MLFLSIPELIWFILMNVLHFFLKVCILQKIIFSEVVKSTGSFFEDRELRFMLITFHLSLHRLRRNSERVRFGLKKFTKKCVSRSSNSNPVLV